LFVFFVMVVCVFYKPLLKRDKTAQLAASSGSLSPGRPGGSFQSRAPWQG
jgi:hypothetical protein